MMESDQGAGQTQWHKTIIQNSLTLTKDDNEVIRTMHEFILKI